MSDSRAGADIREDSDLRGDEGVRPLPPRSDKRPWGSLSKRQQEDRLKIAFAKATMRRLAEARDSGSYPQSKETDGHQETRG